MSFSNYAENLILNWLFTAGAVTRPTAWYVALHTADPTEAGTGTEVSGGSYARQALTLPTASSGGQANSSDITFPAATANWGTVTHAAIWDSLSGGNLLISGTIDESQTVNTGNTYKLPLGQLTTSVD